MTVKTKIAEALYEIITGLQGTRDAEHTKWEKEARQYLKRLFEGKNISFDSIKNTIEIQSINVDKTFHTIEVK